MPLPKPYPPNEIDYQDWDDLADNYAGKAATLIVDSGGKGDYSTIQEAVDALPSTSAGEVLVKGGSYTLTQAVLIEDREDLVIRGVGKATELKVANKIQELIATDAASGQKNVVVADGSSFSVGQHVCVRDDSAFEVNRIASINGNTLTMEDNLANQYDVSDNGRVYTCHRAIYITGASKRIRIYNLLVEGNRSNQEFSREGYYPDEHEGSPEVYCKDWGVYLGVSGGKRRMLIVGKDVVERHNDWGAARIPLELVDELVLVMPRGEAVEAIGEIGSLGRRVRLRRYREDEIERFKVV